MLKFKTLRRMLVQTNGTFSAFLKTPVPRYLHFKADLLGVRKYVQITDARHGRLVLENGLGGLVMKIVSIRNVQWQDAESE